MNIVEKLEPIEKPTRIKKVYPNETTKQLLAGALENLTVVGAPEKPHAISAFSLIMGRRSLSGSPISTERRYPRTLNALRAIDEVIPATNATSSATAH